MNYNLNTIQKEKKKKKRLGFVSVKSLVAHMVEEKKVLLVAFIAMLIAALLNLAGPILVGHAVDNYIQLGKYQGLLIFGGILLGTYIIALFAGYLQTRLMGNVGQRMLYTLRNSVFEKLQELPYDFFNQNKTGDLISRINNDTDKINQFFSQSLMQFLRVILIMIGSGIFLLSIKWELGLAALAPAAFIWLFTRFISPWVKKKNAESLRSVGSLSSEVQESLDNFKVVVAFNRRDYFRQRFALVNRKNYKAAVKAGIANHIFLPVYTLFSNIGLLIVLALGIYFISVGQFTIGLLISFIAYVNSFYNPLRQLASLWANFQLALAAWDRVRKILELENNLPQIHSDVVDDTATLVSFRDVSFSYPNGNEVLHNITFNLKKGKTYAFVGPTGGGKTTTASLISRLYDPTKGTVLLDGKDIRSFTAKERVKRIGFIRSFASPAAVEVGIPMVTTEEVDYERKLGEQRLAYGIEWLEGLGAASASGVVLLTSETPEKVRNLVETDDVVEVIVSTLPSRLSKWLHQDLPHRIERKVDVPIQVVTPADE